MFPALETLPRPYLGGREIKAGLATQDRERNHFFNGYRKTESLPRVMIRKEIDEEFTDARGGEMPCHHRKRDHCVLDRINEIRMSIVEILIWGKIFYGVRDGEMK